MEKSLWETESAGLCKDACKNLQWQNWTVCEVVREDCCLIRARRRHQSCRQTASVSLWKASFSDVTIKAFVLPLKQELFRRAWPKPWTVKFQKSLPTQWALCNPPLGMLLSKLISDVAIIIPPPDSSRNLGPQSHDQSWHALRVPQRSHQKT